MIFRIKEARENAGYSQKELAKIIGVAPNTFHGYESGTIKQEISKLEGILQKAKEAYLVGIDTLEEYGQNKTKLQAQINSLQATLQNEIAQSEPESVTSIKISDVKNLIQSQVDSPTKNRLLSDVFEKITYRKKPHNELKIFLK